MKRSIPWLQSERTSWRKRWNCRGRTKESNPLTYREEYIEKKEHSRWKPRRFVRILIAYSLSLNVHKTVPRHEVWYDAHPLWQPEATWTTRGSLIAQEQTVSIEQGMSLSQHRYNFLNQEECPYNTFHARKGGNHYQSPTPIMSDCRNKKSI